MDIVFFKPDMEFVKWLVKHANGRIICEVGSGSGHLLEMLHAAGGRVFGIEPLHDHTTHMQMRLLFNKPMIQVLPYRVEDAPVFKDMTPDKFLVIFARPCHSDFVENGIDRLNPGVEVLYITVPENLTLYNDLGKYQDDAIQIKHEGNSADDEVVIQLFKPALVAEPVE